MQRIFAVMFLFNSLAFGQIENVLQFHGQKTESIQIDKVIELIRPVPVEVPSTCSRDVPYESYECQDVTRSREECSTIPERQDCTTVDEQRCRPVTRTRRDCQAGPMQTVCRERPTRQVCTENPSRQVCTQNPPRQVCSQGPSRQECRTVTRTREQCSGGASRQVCTQRPTREICTERNGRRTCSQVGGGQDCRTVPGQRTCRQVPHQEQVCSTVPGRQVCSTVPGGQTCRTVSGGQTCSTVGGGQVCENVPGPQVCQDIPYQDQECWNEPRNVCQTIPSHNECRDVPYTENVCGNVTRTRPESYSCMKVELQNKTVQKRLQGTIAVEFDSTVAAIEFPLRSLLKANADVTSFINELSLAQDPQALVIVKENKVNVMGETQEMIQLEGTLKIQIRDLNSIKPQMPSGLGEATFNSETSVLTVPLIGSLSSKGSIELLMTGIWRRSVYTVAEFKTTFPSPKAEVKGNKLLIKLEDDMLDDVVDEMNLTLKLKSEGTSSSSDVILNAKKPQGSSEKTFENQTVTLE